MMKKIFLLLVVTILTTTAVHARNGATSAPSLDCEPGTLVAETINVGNPSSEAGHYMWDWGPIEPATHGGGWGGIDNARVVYSPSDETKYAAIMVDTAKRSGRYETLYPLK